MKTFLALILGAIFCVQTLTIIFALAKAAKRGDEMIEEVNKKK